MLSVPRERRLDPVALETLGASMRLRGISPSTTSLSGRWRATSSSPHL